MTEFFNTICLIITFGFAFAGLKLSFDYSESITWKKQLALFFLGALFLVFSNTDWSDHPNHAPLASVGSVPAGAITATRKYEPAGALVKAKRAYKHGYYLQATTLLARLRPADFKKPEVQSLWTKAIQLETRQLEAAEKGGRDSLSHSYQHALLEAGIDATVKARGKDSRTLYIEIPQMSRTFAYHITHSKAAMDADPAEEQICQFLANGHTDILSYWSTMGFTSVIFADGYTQSWKYELH